MSDARAPATPPSERPLRIVIACGGTGGHIYPGIAVARALACLAPVETLFIGTADRMEATLIPREGFPFATIRVRGFQRSLKPAALLKNLRNLLGLAIGRPLWQAMLHLRRAKADVVIGVGGYVSGPVLLAGWLTGRTTVIIEPNALPGVTNRLLAPLVTFTALAYEASRPRLRPRRCEVTGNPLRPGFLQSTGGTNPACLEGWSGDVPLVVAVGGSLGAQRLNAAIEGFVNGVAGGTLAAPRLNLLHITGERFSSSIASLPEWYRVLPYLHEMPAVMRRATLMIARSGAGTVAEILALGVPSILVPWPGATDNHQEQNARALEAGGAAVVLLDKDCTSEHLATVLSQTLRPARLEHLHAASLSLGKPDAAADIAQLVRELAGR